MSATSPASGDADSPGGGRESATGPAPEGIDASGAGGGARASGDARPDRLAELTAELRDAAGRLRTGALDPGEAAALVEQTARLAGEAAAELDRRARAAG